mmetsp:Transcript_5690/g.15986  ORF Transcript_5690/g.15986 Transcript_5690/m.15986 type:complete len:734 (-) Transcript_5690:1161-3362(-)
MHGSSPLKISSLVMPAPLPGRAKQPGAVHVPGNNHRSTHPSTSIIRPEVKWQPEHRPKPTNAGWGITFKVLYVAFCASSILFITQAEPRYERSIEHGGRKIISHHFLGEVEHCCASIREDADVQLASWGLCGRSEVTSAVAERRAISDATDAEPNISANKYDGDEGLFDVLLESPQILGGIVPAVALLATIWVLLLKQFSIKMVFATELIKAFVVVAISVVTVQSIAVAVQVGLILAALFVGITTRKREDLVKAARTIAHSVAAFHSNPRMLTGLFALKAVFFLHAGLFVATLTLAFDVVEVRRQDHEPESSGNGVLPTTASCDFEYPEYLAPVTRFQCLYWIWFIFVYDQVRLATISTVVGSRHFHADEKKHCTVWQALYNALTTSFGSLALAGALSTVFDSFRKDRRSSSNVAWWLAGPQTCVLLPLQLILWAFGSCLADALALYVRFAVILHSFTGHSLKTCAAKCKSTLQRNFIGGYITAYSARSVLFTTSYIFSVGTALAAWAWIDAEYGSDSLKQWASESNFWLVMFQLLVLVLAFAHPTISIFFVIRINTVLEDRSKGFHYSGQEPTQHQWIGPLAAVFIGCITMIIFRFVTGILLDIVDTKFLCFAIDEDNGIDRGGSTGGGEDGSDEFSEREQEQRTFSALVKAMPDYAVAVEVQRNDIDVEAPIVPGEIQQELPPVAEISIDGSCDVHVDAVEFLEDGQGEEVGFEDEDDRFYEVTLDTDEPA